MVTATILLIVFSAITVLFGTVATVLFLASFLYMGICAFGASVTDGLYIILCYIICSFGIVDSLMANIALCFVMTIVLSLLGVVRFKVIFKTVTFVFICYLIFNNFAYAVFNASLIHLVICAVLYIFLLVLFAFAE